MISGMGSGQNSQSTTVTLTVSGWVASGNRYSQTVSVPFVAANTAVVIADCALYGTDIDEDNEVLAAWLAGPAACNATQGDGSVTFYCNEVPEIDIPVNVAVV